MNQKPLATSAGIGDIKKLLLIALAAILLLVVARTVFYDPWRHYRTVPFDQMTYLRPDVESFCEKLEELIEVAKDGSDVGKLRECMDEVNLLYGDYATQSVFCFAKYSLNVQDDFFAKEQEFFNENDSVVSQKLEEFFYAAAGSPQEDLLEEEYFGDGFFDAYRGESSFQEAVVTLMQREAELENRYSLLLADPKIVFEGREVSYAALMAGELTEDEMQEAVKTYFATFNPSAAAIYCQLVQVRKDIARTMGYESYADYCYQSYSRSFTPQEGKDYCQWVEEYLLPVYSQLQQEGTMDAYSQLYGLEEERLWEVMDACASLWRGPMKEAYDFMRKFSLCQLGGSPAKLFGSYTSYLLNYDAPLIVADRTGTSEDLRTVAHEFGHFLDFYMNYGSETGIDLAECASQGMEMLVYSHLDRGISQEDAKYLLDSRLLWLLQEIVEQSSFHRFELAVYELPEDQLTPQRINQLAQEILFVTENSYYSSLEEYASQSWIGIKHFFTSPLYTLSYALSADAALQVYEAEQKGEGTALYLGLLQGEERFDFSGGLESAGFADPFTQERVLGLKEFFVPWRKAS